MYASGVRDPKDDEMYEPATTPTMYFIGVTTGKSSIMRVFPAWARELDLSAEIKGIDFEPRSNPASYREAVSFIKSDPNSLGALVTTHKLTLLSAARDLFDELGPYAELLSEVSSISKRGGKLIGHAKDPISSGASLDAILPDGHWSDTGGELLLIGAGGSSLALTIHLHSQAASDGDIPKRIIVTNRSQPRLDEMQDIHNRIRFSIPIDYVLAPSPVDNDAAAARLAPGSMVVNATGLGKDIPGSPFTDAVVFPEGGYVWEFNYRGDLIFLDQANAQSKEKDLTVVDGWEYFIHGWTQVIAEVFDISIPSSGPLFDRLSKAAKAAARG
ncbi:MAG: shikimate dehydrogenase [Acidimicrobiia bacterium]|nr:shikimate dehydrogenase [Acidimicrobiia bacterium]